MNPKLTPGRLSRRVMVCIRQSSPTQVIQNQESQSRQYGLEQQARELGFREVVVIDEDIAKSGAGRPESSQFNLGKPPIGLDALRELRDFLSTVQASAGCGKASLKVVPKEGLDETAEATHPATASSAAAGARSGESASGQTKRPRAGTGRTFSEGRRRERQQPVRKATEE